MKVYLTVYYKVMFDRIYSIDKIQFIELSFIDSGLKLHLNFDLLIYMCFSAGMCRGEGPGRGDSDIDSDI